MGIDRIPIHCMHQNTALQLCKCPVVYSTFLRIRRSHHSGYRGTGIDVPSARSGELDCWGLLRGRQGNQNPCPAKRKSRSLGMSGVCLLFCYFCYFSYFCLIFGPFWLVGLPTVLGGIGLWACIQYSVWSTPYMVEVCGPPQMPPPDPAEYPKSYFYCFCGFRSDASRRNGSSKVLGKYVHCIMQRQSILPRDHEFMPN
jgi:hypothetical protein